MPGSFCAAKGCSNHSYNTREKDISFHRFPIQCPHLLNQWLVAIKRMDYTPTSNSRLCSLHFEESCFTYQNFTNRRQIKSDAIPTLFCHQSQGHRGGTLSQRLQCLKEKELLQQNLTSSRDCCSKLNSEWVPRLTFEEKAVKNCDEVLDAAKKLPATDLQAHFAAKVEQECVMEPEIILEESENCTLQFQPEVGVLSKFERKELCRTNAIGAATSVQKQGSNMASLSNPLITLSPSRLYLVKSILGKSGECIKVGSVPEDLMDQCVSYTLVKHTS